MILQTDLLTFTPKTLAGSMPNMWPPSSTLMSLVIIHHVMYCAAQLQVTQTLEERLSLIQIKALRQLCPRVDICSQNATDPTVKRNGILDDGVFVSLCHGCSCHEDCHDMLNCCFPSDKDTHANDAAKLPFPQNNSSKNDATTASILDDSQRDIITTSDYQGNTRDPVDLDNERTTDGIMLTDEITSTKQCLYSQTGTPGKNWVRYVPAYRIVSRAPPGGCLTDVPMDRAPGKDPCGSGPVVPWGDLYPVIVSDQGTIYKNAPCARCHGASGFDHMDAVLVCDLKDKVTGRDLSVADHFTLLQNENSSSCFIAFDYKDRAMLKDNRCFVETVASCPISYNADSVPIPDGVNITHKEVINACQSGLSAPVLTEVAYQNAFCVICSYDIATVYGILERYMYTGERGFGTGKTTYLLDLLFLSEINNKAKGMELEASYQEICLLDDSSLEIENCRRVQCPSGQLRDKTGVCRYPSKRWNYDSVTLIVKLDYVNTNISVQKMYDSGQHTINAIVEGFRGSSPWPSWWKIKSIWHAYDDGSIDASMAVELIATVTNPSIVFRTIQLVMARPWTLTVNGMAIPLVQSILEYSVGMEFNRLVPMWQIYDEDTDAITHALNVSPPKWRVLYDESMMFGNQYRVSKLFTCEAVSLTDDEYVLLANDLVLMNNLTGEVLFDREFELIDSIGDGLIPQVCVSDTPFRMKTTSTGSLNLPGTALLIALSIGTIFHYSK